MKRRFKGDDNSVSLEHPSTEGNERKQEIIIVASEIIGEKGLGGLRIHDVAQRVGINNATLHYYFPTKESLIEAVARLVGQQFINFEISEPERAVSISPTEQMHAYFLSLAQQLKTSPARFIIMSELFVAAQRDIKVRQALGAEEGWQQYLVSILEEGIAKGEFKADLNSKETALTIIAFCKGIPLLNLESEALTKIVELLEEWFVRAAIKD